MRAAGTLAIALLTLAACASEPDFEQRCEIYAEARCTRLAECEATRTSYDQCYYTHRYTCVAIEYPRDLDACTDKLRTWPCELLPDDAPPECDAVRIPKLTAASPPP